MRHGVAALLSFRQSLYGFTTMRCMLRSTLSCCVFLIALTTALADDLRISIARDYANQNRLVLQDERESNHAIEENQLQRETSASATSYVFAIRRHARKLLSPQQAISWESLVAKRSPQLRQFHDDRNVLRAYFFACAWELPALEPGSERDRKRQELCDWLDVWMQVRQQEQFAHHRLCRDAWQLLNESQRRALDEGKWDEYVKTSTGHTRNYFGDRIVTRVLGTPSDVVEFQSHSKQFETTHVRIQSTLLDVETRFRRATFAFPKIPDQTTSDLAMLDTWAPVDTAYRAYFLSQAQHIDELSRVGYMLGSQAIRAKLLSQPNREMKNLEEKIETKLKSGRTLHAMISAAAKH